MMSSADKLKNYAFMTGKPFTYKLIMVELGMCQCTAQKAIRELLKSGDIRLISAKNKGIYRISTSKQKEAARAERLRLASEDMRVHGDEYHQILSEVM